MDCIIIHDNGWACSNKAERSSRLSNIKDGRATRYHTIVADDVFNCSGIIEKGITATFILNDGDKQYGWLCDVKAVKGGKVNAQRKKELTELETKVLITKIKK